MLPLFLLLGACPLLATADKPVPVTYYSRTTPDYERRVGPDGEPVAEYYAISFGGRFDGTVWDEAQSKENFPQIAGMVAEHLARQNYRFAPDNKSATLLIALHWGRTLPPSTDSFDDSIARLGSATSTVQQGLNSPIHVPECPQDTSNVTSSVRAEMAERSEAAAALDSSLALLDMDNRARERRNLETARILGYFDEMSRMDSLGGFVGTDRFAELRSELEEPRYYIALTAYDFREAVERQNKKVLWSTRISIRSTGNRFADSIPAMIASAASSFGTNTDRLIRDRRGEVEIGELEVVETAVPSPPRHSR